MIGLERSGVVSIWVGRFPTEQALRRYVEMTFSDEDEVTSPFLTESGLTWYDEDFAECSVSSAPGETLISSHSWGAFIDRSALVDLARRTDDSNALYLIYDFDASASTCVGGQLDLLGVYAYTTS